MRIVTLLPSATEIIYALDREPVGTSHECDYPSAARDKPAMNDTRIDPEATTQEITDQVARAERGGGIYEIDIEALDRADPDLIITQGMCDVCAVDRLVVEDAIRLIDAEPELLTIDPHSLEDVLADIERIGRAVDRTERARDLVAGLRNRVDTVANETADLPPDSRPRVVVLDWTAPVMVAGHWVPGMVEIAGGCYGLEAPGAPSRPHEWADVREYDPDVLVVAPCGFDIDQTGDNLTDITDRQGYDELAAVRDGRAYVVDGNGHVNRPGPRLVDTLEVFARLIHPDQFVRPDPAVARAIPDLTRPTVE